MDTVHLRLFLNAHLALVPQDENRGAQIAFFVNPTWAQDGDAAILSLKFRKIWDENKLHD
ncbi:MAG: hypothetical protein GX315_08835 [Spirochaetales bacterium]|nr:hypothetical protein [Spirochaetales bacterium]